MTIPLAYGELVHAGVARRPFLVPLRLTDIVLEPKTWVTLADGSTSPDLEINFFVSGIDLQNLDNVQLRLQLRPMPGKTIYDLDLRLLIWMSDDILTADVVGATAIPDTQRYIALGYRTTSGRKMPNQVNFGLGTLYTGAAGPRSDRFWVAPGTPNVPEPIRVVGGLVNGPMLIREGRRTTYDPFSHVYTEQPISLRTIGLARTLDPTPLGATSPESGVWVELDATNHGTQPTKLELFAYLPRTVDSPVGPVTVALDPSAGTLLPGTYTYAAAFLQQGGNETSPTPLSAPVTVTDGGSRSVVVTGLPDGPPDDPNDASMRVTKRVIYRTDRSDDGLGGELVKVGEVAGRTGGQFVDHGPGPEPPDGSPEPPLPTLAFQWMRFEYSAEQPLDIDATVSIIGEDTVDRYDGNLVDAPTELNAQLDARGAQNVPPTPRLALDADSVTTSVEIGMRGFQTPWGTGLVAHLDALPEKAGIDWRVHGADFTGVTVIADEGMAEPADGSPTIAAAAVRFGTGIVPSGWPHGEATIGLDLDERAVLEEGRGLVVGRGLRYARLRFGDATWRTDNVGRIRAVILIDDDPDHPPGGDRSLRGRVAMATGPLARLAARARELPDRVEIDVHPGALRYQLRSRLALVRVDATLRDEDTAALGPDVRGFIDDTGPLDKEGNGLTVTLSKLIATIGGVTTEKLTGAHLVGTQNMRVRADVRGLVLDSDVIELHGELLVPKDVVVALDPPVEVKAAEPGVSGRVAVSWNGHLAATSATPQGALWMLGADPPDGMASTLRAATARVYSVAAAGLTTKDEGDRSDLDVHADFYPTRPNPSVRVTARELDQRYRPDIMASDWPRTPAALARLDDRGREWMRARMELVPQSVAATVIQQAGGLAGIDVRAASGWGMGEVWMEPGKDLGVDARAPALGPALAIGNLRLDVLEIPSRVRLAMLAHSELFEAEVSSMNFPSVEPPPADWQPGGVAVRINGPLRVARIRYADPSGQEAVCVGGSPSLRIKWFEALVREAFLVPAEGADPGVDRQSFVWSAKDPEPPPPATPPPPDNPCLPAPAGIDRNSLFGYRIHEDIRARTAARLYEMRTEQGRRFSKWNELGAVAAEPERRIEAITKMVSVNLWRLGYEVQMDGYRGEITFYPERTTDNPFGDWEAGPGQWWLRLVDGLKIWLISSGDAYAGNTGNGFPLPTTDGLFSTLPPIFIWSYP